MRCVSLGGCIHFVLTNAHLNSGRTRASSGAAEQLHFSVSTPGYLALPTNQLKGIDISCAARVRHSYSQDCLGLWQGRHDINIACSRE